MSDSAEVVAPVTRARVFNIAWPIVLSNASVPLLGLADTAVIGNLGNAALIGAIAVGAMIFLFLYWGFGFLRMGTTGLTAQALGARDEAEVRATLMRGFAVWRWHGACAYHSAISDYACRLYSSRWQR